MTNEAVTINSITGEGLNALFPQCYLHSGHGISTANNCLMLGSSSDGVTAMPIGETYPFTPETAGDGVRDTSPFYWPPTREFLFLSTHSTVGSPFYAQTLTLNVTRSLNRMAETFEVPINGTGLSGTWFVWSGCLFRDDDGELYATCSHLAGGLTTNLVVGWLKFNAPGEDWEDVTDFVSLHDTNPAIAAFVATHPQINDVFVRKIDGVYHYVFDAGTGGSHELFRSTSATLWTGLTAPVSLGIKELLNVTKTAAITNTDATVTVADTSNLLVGMVVIGTGIPALATVLSITNGTTFELSANATATNGAVSLLFTSDIEGAYLEETTTGDLRCYFQAIFGPVRYVDTANFTAASPTWSTPAFFRWRGRLAMGNGGVILLKGLDAQAAVAAAGCPVFDPEDDGITFSTLVFPTEIGRIHLSRAPVNGSPLITLGATLSKSGTKVHWAINGNIVADAVSVLDGNLVAQHATHNRVWFINGSGTWYAPQQAGTTLYWIFNGVDKMTLNNTGTLALVGGIRVSTSAGDVASGDWYDNAGTWTKKP